MCHRLSLSKFIKMQKLYSLCDIIKYKTSYSSSNVNLQSAYKKEFSTTDWQGSIDPYTISIPVTEHNRSAQCIVSGCFSKDENDKLTTIIPAYEINSNGDITLYSDTKIDGVVYIQNLNNALITGDGSVSFTDTTYNPNLLINGDFQVWQRGDSFTLTQASAANDVTYTADRWYGKVSSAYNVFVEKNENMCILSTDSSDGNYSVNFGQILEERQWNAPDGFVLTIRGSVASGTCNVSAKISNGGNKVTTGVLWNSGSDSLRILINKPAEDGQLTLDIKFSASSPVYLKSIKLEPGTVATRFVPRSYQEELNDCMRYFEVWAAGNQDLAIPVQRISSATAAASSGAFRVPKRVKPTLYQKYANANNMGRIVCIKNGSFSYTPVVDCTAITLGANSTDQYNYTIGFTTESGLTNDIRYAEWDNLGGTASNVIGFDAEIYPTSA